MSNPERQKTYKEEIDDTLNVLSDLSIDRKSIKSKRGQKRGLDDIYDESDGYTSGDSKTPDPDDGNSSDDDSSDDNDPVEYTNIRHVSEMIAAMQVYEGWTGGGLLNRDDRLVREASNYKCETSIYSAAFIAGYTRLKDPAEHGVILSGMNSLAYILHSNGVINDVSEKVWKVDYLLGCVSGVARYRGVTTLHRNDVIQRMTALGRAKHVFDMRDIDPVVVIGVTWDALTDMVVDACKH